MACEDDNFAELERKMAEKRAKEKRQKEENKKRRKKKNTISVNARQKKKVRDRRANTVANAEESAVDIDELGAQLREAREREERHSASVVRQRNARFYAKKKSTAASVATSRSSTIGEDEESSQRTSVHSASVDDGLSNNGVVTTSKEDREDPPPFERQACVRCDGSCGKNVSYSQFGGRMEQCS